MQAGTHQYDMPVYLHACLRFGFFQIGDIDVAQVRDMTQIQANRFAHEHIQGHVIDGQPVWAHVVKGVHVGGDVIEHR